MNITGIDYLDRTWNPLAMRCTRVSPACDNCWHLRMANRKAGNPKLSDLERRASAGLIPPVLIPDRLGEPLRLKKPQRIGVQFMGDLGHEAVEWNQLFAIFQVMGMAPQHQFMVLTKRPERFARELGGDLGLHLQRQDWCKKWPLPNVWLGVTIENQEWLEKRMHWLMQTPAAKRFVSYEPALGPISFRWAKWQEIRKGENNEYDGLRKLDWIIAGGETGPKARPSHPDWFRQARDQAVAAGVPFWFKSWGNYAYEDIDPVKDYPHVNCIETSGELFALSSGHDTTPPEYWVLPDNPPTLLWQKIPKISESSKVFRRVGRRAPGRILDGRTWEELPEGVEVKL